MTKTQRELLEAFRAAPSPEQRVLELLAVSYLPVTRKEALQHAKRAGIVGPQREVPTLVAWRMLVEDLVASGLVAEARGFRIRCHPDVAESIMCLVSRQGRLEECLEAADTRPQSLLDDAHPASHYLSGDELFHDIRLALHLNQSERLDELLEIWLRDHRGHEGGASPVLLFCNRPFDREWMASRDPYIQDGVLGAIMIRSHERLEPAGEAAGLLEELEERDEAPDWALRYIVQHHLLCGNLDAAERWIGTADGFTADLYRGRLCALRGQYLEAVASFESAIKYLRKGGGFRSTALPAFPATFYVFALLGTRKAGNLSKARKYAASALKKKDIDIVALNAFECMQIAVDLADGKTPHAQDLAVELPTTDDLDGLTRLFNCMARTWVGGATGEGARPDLQSLRRQALDGGYAWIAAECAYLLEAVRPGQAGADPPTAEHEGMGAVPVASVVRVEQPWERSLSALGSLIERLPARAPRQASQSRLSWRLEMWPEGASPKPYEQKQGKGGKWSAGRTVALKRLYERKNVPFLTDQDERICAAIKRVPTGYYGNHDYSLDDGEALDALVGHPLVFQADSPAKRMDIVRAEPELRVTTFEDTVTIKIVPEPPEDTDTLAIQESPTRVLVYTFGRKHQEIADLLGPAGLDVPTVAKARIAPVVASVSELVTVHSDLDASGTDGAEIPADSRLRLQLTPYDQGLQVEPVVRPFGPEGPAYVPGEGGEVVFAAVGGERARTRRDLHAEALLLDEALAACPSLKTEGRFGAGWTLSDPVECLELLDSLRKLEESVTVEWPKGETLRVRRSADTDRLSLKIKKTRDWFSLDGKVEFEPGLVLGLRELLERVEETSGRFLPLGGKEFLALTQRFRERIEDLAAYASRHGKGLRFHSARAPAMEALVDGAGKVDGDKHWLERVRRFREAQSFEPTVPSTLQAELRGYQVDGFRWAARLAAWGAGACLADDMGLGKTVQALAMAVARAPGGPALVVAPTSVCPNWVDEARRFAPTLRPLAFGPGDRGKALEGLAPFDLVVCSYGLLRQETALLAAVGWETVVLDEAQAIKNQATMRSKAAMALSGGFKMITTGTPIENHLGELWNLFQFINPGLLGSSESFTKQYATPIHQRNDLKARSQLKRLIQPFILRRTKAAVLDELPARTEITLRVEMGEAERALYEAARVRATERLQEETEDGRPGHVRILAEIMKLRRACCHPRLLLPDAGIAGSKIEAFSEQVADLLANGHKALVFSQFVDHLSIVRERLDQQGTDYCYLDGSTPPSERKRQVDAFQAGRGELFLISLRAGGQGLNLTAADYVIHLDPWWNPAVEDQASDRAHRIGQTRPVTIYRLVMKDTIEEKIVDLHATKRDIADSLLDGTDMSGKISADELLALIRDG